MIKESIKELQKEAELILNLYTKKGGKNNRFTAKRLSEIEEEIAKQEDIVKLWEKQNIKSEQEQDVMDFLEKTISPFRRKKNISNEEKQSAIRALINKIVVIWMDEQSSHVIQVYYKFDKHSEILLTKNLILSYKKMGYSLRAKEYKEDIEIKINSPSLRPRELNPNSKDFFIKTKISED